jgi:hypothetical protein
MVGKVTDWRSVMYAKCKVAGSLTEPEPVERQHFAGAGARLKNLGSGSRAGYLNS